MMKKVSLLILLVATAMTAWGQDPSVELPWLPKRDTNHIRTVRTYAVDSVTGVRQLRRTEHYDRHGYLEDTTCRNIYDAQGRLVMAEVYNWVSTSDNPMRRLEIEWRYNITYSSDGAVQHIRKENFSFNAAGVWNHDLLSRKEHPRFGMTECVYLSKFSRWEWVDTIRFLREYDDAGRLLRNFCDMEGVSDYYDTRYYYDSSGRIIACATTYYESLDTFVYHYDSYGIITSKTGHIFDLGMEAEVTVTFRPDGTLLEKQEHWTSDGLYDDIPFKENHLVRYDERGVPVYWKGPAGIIEFEIEYWE